MHLPRANCLIFVKERDNLLFYIPQSAWCIKISENLVIWVRSNLFWDFWNDNTCKKASWIFMFMIVFMIWNLLALFCTWIVNIPKACCKIWFFIFESNFMTIISIIFKLFALFLLVKWDSYFLVFAEILADIADFGLLDFYFHLLNKIDSQRFSYI